MSGSRTRVAIPCGGQCGNCPLVIGPTIQALAFYLKHFQHVSYERLQGLFRDVFGLVISQGALMNMLRRGATSFAAQKNGIVSRLRTVSSDTYTYELRRHPVLRGQRDLGGRTPPKSLRQNLPVQALSFVRSSSRSRSRYERPLMLST